MINTARGELVDEDALYQALKNKRIAGAGLDVIPRERDVARGTYVSPLSSLENVLITPHYAGHTFDTFIRRIEIGYDNITRTAKGEKPKYVVK
jgi:phosphoglycerate dehydrogenase-like enzyme